MVRFSPNLKKALLIGTVILLGCDVSMLFAQPASSSSSNQQPTDPQLQQLQSQVQAQIQALQNQSQSVSTAQTPANTLTPAQQAAVQQAAAQQMNTQLGNNNAPAVAVPVASSQKTDNILPPSPFNTPQAASTPQQIPPPAAAGLQNIQQQKLTAQPATAAATPTPDTVTPSPFNEQITLPSATAAAAIPSPNAAAGSAAVAAAIASSSPQVAAAPGTPPPLDVSDSEVSDAAFSAMIKNALPLSPDQIQKLRSVYMASQYAAQSSPVTPPRPTATSQFVDLSPGATPPVIRLAQGFVTSLVFVDSTGAPWDIESYDVGNPSAFNIQWDKSSNTMMVQSTALYTYGNVAVKLRNLNTPVMLTLVPGQKAVDYRVDLRIQGLGPDAKPLTMSTLPASTSSDLLNVLDGVPPSNSQALTVEGGDCQAWLSGNTMYVRTRLNILSPGWVATLSSADGMHAYEMQPTPMLLVSQNGEVLQLKVEGF